MSINAPMTDVPIDKLPHFAQEDVKSYFLTLQNNIINTLTTIDGKSFHQDVWQREQGGGGITRVLEEGHVFARAGVNFSHVFGNHLPPSASAHRPDLVDYNFEAMGVSVILHPHNPYVPTVHMNVRFFAAQKDNGPTLWWFAGGMDLTPYYGFHEDAQHFHQICYKALAPFGNTLYPEYKAWADRYYFIRHRNEPRGIGGIFFDDVNQLGFLPSFTLTQSVGDHFLPAYLPILERRRAIPYGKREKAFQNYRRSRYIEFNLVYDRGTLFGLQSAGRIESILISLPPEAKWKYNWFPEPDSAEEKLYNEFLVAKDWLNNSMDK